MVRKSRLYTSATGAGALLLAALMTNMVGGVAVAGGDRPGETDTKADFIALNNSGVRGETEVDVLRQELEIEVEAKGLASNLPHAQHIHFGEQARHECPTVAEDANGDFRLTTAEGVPAYGPVQVSLTTTGDTSPASVLAVDRYPTAPGGKVDYDRVTSTSQEVAQAIARGDGVVVIHGVDYNDNGIYDFDSAGASELNADLPAEATDPAACAPLHVHR